MTRIKGRALFPITAALLLVAGPGVAWAQVAAVATATRTSGVAPLAVFFDGTDTRWNGQVATQNAAVFKSLDYSWSFGDPDSGTWSVSGRSKNEAFGAVAAHVFETPGTYEVTLTVREPQGNGVSNTSITVTVSAADSLSSVCVARDNQDWSGCPTTNRKVYSDFRTAIETETDAGHRRILFRRGDRYSTTSSITQITANGPGVIGAFGSGAKPIVDATGSSLDLIKLSGRDWRVTDLSFVDNSTTESDCSGRVFSDAASDALVLRVDAANVCALIGDGPGAERRRFFLVDGLLRNVHTMLLRGADPSHIAVQGVRFDGVGSRHHATRFGECRKCVWQHNKVTDTGTLDMFTNLTIRACSVKDADSATCSSSESPDSRFIIVSDNSLVSYGAAALGFGCGSSSQSCISRLVLIERNRLRLPPSGTSALFDAGPGEQWVFRNNVAVFEKSGKMIRVNEASNPVKTNEGIEIYANSAYNASSSSVSMVTVDSGTSGTPLIRNNVLWSPNGGGQVVDGPGSWTASNNVFLTGSAQRPFVGSTPDVDSIDSFALNPDSTAARLLIDAGARVPVGRDGQLGTRPVNGAWDVGAMEFGAQPGGGSKPPPPVLLGGG